jgi:hypothetical protein
MGDIIMSKWRKALKNKRRFDARYFLNERVEGQEVVENSVQQGEVKRNFHDFSFNSWLTEAEEVVEESGDKQANLAQLKKELDDLNREYRQAQFGSWEEANISQAMSMVKDKIAKLTKSDIEELEEAAKPDFLDLDKDGDKEESMADAAKDKDDVKEG